MSADITTFHSSEVDDQSHGIRCAQRFHGAAECDCGKATIEEGWYIGRIDSEGVPLVDGAVGPYATEVLARAALSAGVWL